MKRGDTYVITQRGPGNYQILVWNYVPITNTDSLRDKAIQSLTDTYSYYDNRTAFEAIVHLTGLPAGTYRIDRYLIDRYHGSLVDLALGSLNVSNVSEGLFLHKIHAPSPAQIHYFKTACVPEERTHFRESNGELTLTTKIYPHNVCLWDIYQEM